MSPLPVEVHVTGTAAGSAYVAQLIDACNDAAPENGCTFAGETTTSDTNVVAIVEWDEDRRRAFIRIAPPDTSGSARPLERRLEFDPEDREPERWRSVGLTIATMVDSLTEQRPEQASNGDAQAPVAAAATPHHEQPSTDHREQLPPDEMTRPPRAPGAQGSVPKRSVLSIDAAGIAGPGLDDGYWRLGGLVRVWYSPWQDPLLFLGTVGYALRDRQNEVSVAWTTAGAGLGYGLRPISGAELRVYAEVLGEFVTADVVDTNTGESDDGHAFDLGIGTGADVSYDVSSWLAVVLGGEIGSTTKAVDIRVRDSRLARGSAITYTLLAGARLTLGGP